MAVKDLKAIVSEVKELPTLPQVAVALMDLLDNPNTGAQEINRVMSRDPALAGKILKIVNSAYYGLSNKVSSLNQAIVILGFKTVKSVALSASVMGLFKEKGSERFDKTAFWRHSIACACVARLVARKQKGIDPDAAFSVGLLHDIGKLVINQYDPASIDEIVAAAEAGAASFGEAEAKVLATTHCEVGRWLCEEWGLPKTIVTGIAYHHDLAGAPQMEMAAIIEFANYLAKVKGLAASGSFEQPALPKKVWELLAIDRADLPEMVNTINEEIEAASSWLEEAV